MRHRLAAVVLVALAFCLAGCMGDEPPAAPVETTPPLVTLRIIFPEGFTRREMADRVAAVREIAIDKRGVTPRLTKTGYLEASGAAVPPVEFRKDWKLSSIEGFLFPATYELGAGANAGTLVDKQLDAFRDNFGSLNLKAAKRRNLTAYDVLIIASLIERETPSDRERPLIASVIYNRLKLGEPLGIDATTRYFEKKWSGKLLQSELDADNAYNTRINSGLPPTPIGNPGLASMKAAAKPANTDYLFYVAKPGACHAFAETNEQHERNVAIYQAAVEKNGGKAPPQDCG
jgi:peptidoglycan lytic transglycosylase G